MGAVAEVRELASVREELGVSLAAKVATRNGPCSLAAVFAGAGRVEALRYALDHGADLAAKDDAGETALHLAALGGHAEACALLLDGGTDVAAIANTGTTA